MPENVSVRSITDDIQQVFAPQALERKLNFSIHIEDAQPVELYIDKQRLEQILKNLLSNAFKFTPKDGIVTLTIHKPKANTKFTHERLLKAEKVIAFSITDTGIGISEDKQNVIFEAFKQADGSTSRKYGGTGLGLSISRELAVLLGGEIHIQISAKKAKEAPFTIYLPG